MLYIIALVILALAGNYLLRRFLKKVDSKPAARGLEEPLIKHLPATPGEPSPEEILRLWGRPRTNGPVVPTKQIHPKIASLLVSYEQVGPDEYFRPIDSVRADSGLEQNQGFIQIGVWGDGSEVLAKKDLSDERIYLADIEEAEAGRPLIIANSVGDFLVAAWRYHKDSEK
ncbi:MAG: hypothetical protein ACOZE5_02445 [Verrucomicrobiota bacterium]